MPTIEVLLGSPTRERMQRSWLRNTFNDLICWFLGHDAWLLSWSSPKSTGYACSLCQRISRIERLTDAAN